MRHRVAKNPTARLVLPVSATVGASVLADGAQSVDGPGGGGIRVFAFDMGDGVTQVGKNQICNHVYAAPGSYIVELTVTNKRGLKDTIQQTLAVMAASQPTLVLIAVNPPSASVGISQTAQLSAVGHYSDGTTQSLPSVTWGSSDSSIATVNDAGLVAGVALGAVDITASVNGLHGTAEVSVTHAVPGPEPPTDEWPVPPTLVANSGSAADINAACGAAHADGGDCVGVPKGTWQTGVVGISKKNLMLVGQGQGQTVLNFTDGNNGIYCDINGSDRGHMRIAHMTVQGVAATLIGFHSRAQRVVPSGRPRVDHLHFNFQGGQRTGIYIGGVNYPLVDHNKVDWSAGIFMLAAGVIDNEGAQPVPYGDFLLWLPYDYGTLDAAFMEDNEFIPHGNSLAIYDASSGGGRVVIRKNVAADAYVYNHWVRGAEVAASIVEVYQNKFTAGPHYGPYPLRMEAGTGTFHSNEVIGYNAPDAPFIMLNDRRADGSEAGAWLGKCDGTHAWDGHDDPAAPGWPALQQIGRGPGKTLAELSAGAKQRSMPFHVWGNTPTVGVWATPAAYIKNTPHPNGEVDYVEGSAPAGYVTAPYPHPGTL